MIDFFRRLIGNGSIVTKSYVIRVLIAEQWKELHIFHNANEACLYAEQIVKAMNCSSNKVDIITSRGVR